MKSEKHSREYPQIPNTHLPEDLLEKFVADLKAPIDIVENSLRNLPKFTNYDNGEEIFPQLGQATQTVNDNIRSVIAYLHLKLKDGFIDIERKIAFEILGQFTHVLRECSAPLEGFINVCQQYKLSDDEFKQNVETIEHYGERLVKAFKALDSNWRIWLETRNFDWEISDL